MDAKHFAALIGLMVLLSFTNTGCFTLAGAGLGAAIDLMEPKQIHQTGWQTEKMEKGASVSVSLRDSTQINGVYMGTVRQASEAYVARYNAFRSGIDSTDLPAPGDTITLVRSSGKQETFEFQGFDRATDSRAKTPKLVLVVKRAGRDRLESVPLRKGSRMIDSKGVVLTTPDLTTRLVRGGLPLMSMVEVTGKSPLLMGTDQFIDIRNAEGLPPNPSQHSVGSAFAKFKKGRSFTGILKDGSLSRGVFLGIAPMAAEAYALHYAAQQALLDTVPLPALGSTIRITHRGDKGTVRTFHGFDYRTGPKEKGVPYVLVSLIGRSKTDAVRLDAEGEWIEWDGGRLSGYQLRELVQVGKLPLISTVRLLPETEVPVDQIATVTTHVKKGAFKTLVSIGLGVDVIILACKLWGDDLERFLEWLAGFVPDYGGM